MFQKIKRQKQFPRGQLAIVSFDIAISHEERWLYLNRNRSADSQPLYVASSVKKLINKHYCIWRKCIYNRIPYFTVQLLKLIDRIILTLTALRIPESCIVIRINLNFYFHTSLWCLKLFEARPRSANKKKIKLIFSFWPGLGR